MALLERHQFTVRRTHENWHPLHCGHACIPLKNAIFTCNALLPNFFDYASWLSYNWIREDQIGINSIEVSSLKDLLDRNSCQSPKTARSCLICNCFSMCFHQFCDRGMVDILHPCTVQCLDPPPTEPHHPSTLVITPDFSKKPTSFVLLPHPRLRSRTLRGRCPQ